MSATFFFTIAKIVFFLNGHEANYEADIKPVQSVTNGILLFSYRRNSLQVTIPELL